MRGDPVPSDWTQTRSRPNGRLLYLGTANDPGCYTPPIRFASIKMARW